MRTSKWDWIISQNHLGLNMSKMLKPVNARKQGMSLINYSPFICLSNFGWFCRIWSPSTAISWCFCQGEPHPKEQVSTNKSLLICYENMNQIQSTIHQGRCHLKLWGIIILHLHLWSSLEQRSKSPFPLFGFDSSSEDGDLCFLGGGGRGRFLNPTSWKESEAFGKKHGLFASDWLLWIGDSCGRVSICWFLRYILMPQIALTVI